MKLVSWNVNGLRACLGKGFLDYCAQEDADVVTRQHTRNSSGYVDKRNHVSILLTD